MRRRVLPIVASVLLAACAQGASTPTPSPEASASYLYVISGTSGSIEGTTLTLHGVPSVLWFTDRPERDAGHMTVADFLAGWDQGSGSFAADPPNAALSILAEDGGDPIEAVMELDSVSGDGTNLAFEVTPIEGTLPEGTFGTASLFIDTCDITYSWCKPL